MAREKSVSDQEDDKPFDSSDKGGDKGGFADLAKKLFLTGLGAVSMSDRLPKEAVNYILDQAEKKKEDLIDRLAIEASKFLDKLDVSQEIQKALRGLEIDLHATLRFSGKSNGSENQTVESAEETEDTPIVFKTRYRKKT